MARYLYGGSPADFTVNSLGHILPNGSVTVWTAMTGGTQVTDLTDLTSTPISTVTSDDTGSIRFYGPDGFDGPLWLQGSGARLLIRPSSSSLITTVTAKGDLLVATSDHDLENVAVGADGQVLIADSGQTAGVKWGQIGSEAVADDADIARTKIAGNALTESLVNAAGDLFVGTGDGTVGILPADTNGLVLTSDDGETTGVKWSAYGIADIDIGTVDTGTAAVTLTGNPEDGYELNLTLPAVGDGSITPTSFAASTVPGNMLTVNEASVETNTAGFGVGGCTIARDTGHAFVGSASLQATRSGAGTSYVVAGGGDYISAPRIPVQAGVAYTFTATVMSVDSTQNCFMKARFYDSGGTQIGGSWSGPAVVLSTDWQTLTYVAVAPAGAVKALMWVEKAQASAGTETWNMDAWGFWRGVGGEWALPGVPIVGAAGRVAIRPLTSTGHTLEAFCAGQIIEFNTSSATTVTVPPYSTVPFPIGTVIEILQAGTGAVTVVAGSGVTVNANPGLHLAGQWALATLINRAKDTWVLVGNLSAT